MAHKNGWHAHIVVNALSDRVTTSGQLAVASSCDRSQLPCGSAPPRPIQPCRFHSSFFSFAENFCRTLCRTQCHPVHRGRRQHHATWATCSLEHNPNMSRFRRESIHVPFKSVGNADYKRSKAPSGSKAGQLTYNPVFHARHETGHRNPGEENVHFIRQRHKTPAGAFRRQASECGQSRARCVESVGAKSPSH